MIDPGLKSSDTRDPRGMVRRLVDRAAIIAMAAMAMIGWLSSGIGVPQGAPQTAGPVVPVTAGTVAVEDVPVFLHGIGTAQAYNMVSIKSRADGQIIKIDFKEGQEVKEGDLLLQIDPRPYQAALAQAEATKQKDEAQLAGAQADLERYAQLVPSGHRSKPPSSTSVTPTSVRRSTDGSAHGSSTRAIWCAQPITPCSLRSPR